MWGLILYVICVIIGALVPAGVGYYVEKEFSSALSLIVFLSLFFANFGVAWFITVFVVEKIVQLRLGSAGTGERTT